MALTMIWWVIAGGAVVCVGAVLWSMRKRSAARDQEICYFEKVETWLRSAGHYESVICAQGIDEKFCTESLKVYKAGFQTNQSEKVVGALVADAANQYRSNRQYSIAFLKKVRSNFGQQVSRRENG